MYFSFVKYSILEKTGFPLCEHAFSTGLNGFLSGLFSVIKRTFLSNQKGTREIKNIQIWIHGFLWTGIIEKDISDRCI